MSKHDAVILQPEYVEVFQCDGSKCNAKCCKAIWRIDIDTNAYKKYQRIKNPEVRNKILSSLEPNQDISGYMKIKFNSDGACPLLCSDNLCYVQRNLGVEALSLTCQVYPRVVKRIGDCQLRVLSMSCPMAAEAALFSEHGMDIKSIVPAKEDKAWKIAVQIGKAEQNKLYKDIDDRIAANVILGGLSILQSTVYTREQRLVLLGLFMDRADDLRDAPDEAEAIAELALFYNGEVFRQEIKGLFNDWIFYPKAHGQLLTSILSAGQKKENLSQVSLLLGQALHYEENYNKFHTLIENDYGPVIDRFWQQEFLFRSFPFCIKGSFLHNYFAYLMLYKIWEMYINSFYQGCDGSVTKKDLLNLMTIYGTIIDHRRYTASSIVKRITPFEAEPIKLMQVLLRLK